MNLASRWETRKPWRFSAHSSSSGAIPSSSSARAKRDDLADKEEAEIKIIELYLPAGASEEEIDAAVASALQETGATSAKDMGKVMKAAMAKLAGKNVDGKQVSERVRAQARRVTQAFGRQRSAHGVNSRPLKLRDCLRIED